MKDLPVTIKASHTSGGRSELRITVDGGGPWRQEFIVNADEEKTQLAVWNPWRQEWATVDLAGHGERTSDA